MEYPRTATAAAEIGFGTGGPGNDMEKPHCEVSASWPQAVSRSPEHGEGTATEESGSRLSLGCYSQ